MLFSEHSKRSNSLRKQD